MAPCGKATHQGDRQIKAQNAQGGDASCHRQYPHPDHEIKRRGPKGKKSTVMTKRASTALLVAHTARRSIGGRQEATASHSKAGRLTSGVIWSGVGAACAA